MALESPKAKKRRRYYKSKLIEFAVLNDKWTKEFQSKGFGGFLHRNSTAGGTTGGMFLAYNEYENAAWQYADKKAEANLTWYQSIVSGNGFVAIASFIVAVVIAVASFFCPPVAAFGVVLFGGATALTTIAAITSAVAVFVATSAARFAEYKTSGLGALAMFASSARAALKNRSVAEKQSYALTNLMIFGEYSIYANGSIFNAGAAGAGQTFSPTIAYDSSKGIRGDLQKEPLDEMITGRVGGDLAGGQNFHANVLSVDIPLAKFELSAQKVQERLVQRYVVYNKLVAAAFSEFGEAGINADGRAQVTYNALTAGGFKASTLSAIHANDSLNKLKNYNKNLRADFSFIDKNTFFRERGKGISDKDAALAKMNYNEIMSSKEISDDRKAEYYIDRILMILDFLEFFAEQITFFFYYHDSSNNRVVYPSPIRTQFFNIRTRFSYVNATHITNEYGGSVYLIPDLMINTKLYNFGNNDIYNSNAVPIEDFSNFHFLDDYFYKDTKKVLNGEEIITLYKKFLAHFYKVTTYYNFVGVTNGYFIVPNEAFIARYYHPYKYNFDYFSPRNFEGFVIPIDETNYNFLSKELENPLPKYPYKKITKEIYNAQDDERG